MKFLSHFNFLFFVLISLLPISASGLESPVGGSKGSTGGGSSTLNVFKDIFNREDSTTIGNDWTQSDAGLKEHNLSLVSGACEFVATETAGEAFIEHALPSADLNHDGFAYRFALSFITDLDKAGDISFKATLNNGSGGSDITDFLTLTLTSKGYIELKAQVDDVAKDNSITLNSTSKRLLSKVWIFEVSTTDRGYELRIWERGKPRMVPALLSVTSDHLPTINSTKFEYAALGPVSVTPYRARLDNVSLNNK